MDIYCAQLCECKYNSNSQLIESKCINCNLNECGRNKWQHEISEIQKYLLLYQNISIKSEQIIVLKTLFEYILTIPIFVSSYPSFKKTLIEKIKEFSNEDELQDLMKRVEILIESLPNRKE